MITEFKRSNKILNQAKKVTCDPYLYITEGYNFEKTNQIKLAEKSLSFAAEIDPKLMYPKYVLANFYFNHKQTEDAAKVAREILSMKIKVRSAATEQMQADMLYLLTSLPQD